MKTVWKRIHQNRSPNSLKIEAINSVLLWLRKAHVKADLSIAPCLWGDWNKGWQYQTVVRGALILADKTLNCYTHFQVLALSTELRISYPMTQKAHSWGCASLRSMLTPSDGQNAPESKKLGTASRFCSSRCNVRMVVCFYNEVMYSKGWWDKPPEHTRKCLLQDIISTLRDKKWEIIRLDYWFLFRKFSMSGPSTNCARTIGYLDTDD